MNPFVRYTLLRILLFGAVLAVLVAVGVRGLVLLVGALLLSAVLSYLILNGPRQAVVQRLSERAGRRAGRRAPDRDSAVEDADLDAQEQRRGALGPGRSPS